MPSASELRQLGLESHQAGDLDRAEQFYRQALELEPLDADAWHLQGVVAHQRGRHAEAADTIQRAIDLAPSNPIYYANLAEADPRAGQFELAAEHCRTAIKLDPGTVGAYNNLGLALLALGRIDESIAVCHAGLAIKPDLLELWNNLGEAYRAAGHGEDAARCFQVALTIDPAFAPAYLNLGNACRAARRFDEAAACFEKALQFRFGYAKAHSNLSILRLDQQRFEEAEFHASAALRFDPQLPEAHSNMSALRHQQGQLTAALEHARMALQLAPDMAEAHNNLAAILQDRGCAEEALPHFAAAWQSPLAANRANLHSNYLFGMQYVSDTTPERLLEAHRHWNDRHAVPLAAQRRLLVAVRSADRTLRLGLVSADLGCHPVGQFVSAWLPHLNPERVQVICYSDRPVDDELGQRLKSQAAAWRDVQATDDEALAATIRDDRIDILCDLAGHTRSNRLLMFARRPAMVQASWIGYAGTTGLEAMDYLIADRHLVPEGDEAYYRERVLRLPDGWLCYAPPPDAPDVSPPPCLARGHVTFGCFNNPAKITPAVVAAWSEILQRVPGSRLQLKFKWFDDPGTREHFWALFARHGIEAARVELKGWSSQAEHLGCYGEIDLALDTFPFTGGITTCEALWMGVPVVTLVGRSFAARQSYSHLMNVGLGELAAWNAAEFVDRAVAWATDLDRLAAYRSELRSLMKQSPLCDAPRFALHLQDLLREAWRTSCVDR